MPIVTRRHPRRRSARVATFLHGPRDAIADLLAQVPLFSACSKKELQRWRKLAEDIHVDAGHVLVSEGAAGAEFFVIVDGEAEVTATAGRRDARARRLLRRPRAARPGAAERDRHRGDADGARRARSARVRSASIDEVAGLRAQAARRPRAPPARGRPAKIGPVAPDTRYGPAPTGVVVSRRAPTEAAPGRPRRRRARRARHARLSAILPRITELGRRLADQPGGLRQHPRPDLLALLRHGRGDAVRRARGSSSRRGAELRAGRARRPADHQEERAPPPRATSGPACGCGRSCATRPPA